jgi:hypothetical protein
VADITQAMEQEAIADSILDAPIVGSWLDGELAENGEATFASEQNQPEEWADPGPEILDELAQELTGEQPGQQEAQPEAQATRELTPVEIHDGIQQMHATVEELGLNDETAAQRLAHDLTAPFGADPRSVDSQALGQTMASAVLSAVQICESGQQVGPIPPAAAAEFTGDFLRSIGMDPRTIQVDSQQFATAVLGGTLNFLETVKVYGLNASLDRLNSPEGAEVFAGGLMKAFGITEPVTREHALHLADTGGKYILAVLQRLARALPQEEEQSPRQSRRSSGERSSSRGRSQFQSNRDIFDADAMGEYELRHGRL